MLDLCISPGHRGMRDVNAHGRPAYGNVRKPRRLTYGVYYRTPCIYHRTRCILPYAVYILPYAVYITVRGVYITVRGVYITVRGVGLVYITVRGVFLPEVEPLIAFPPDLLT